jgi:hypothetical protein
MKTLFSLVVLFVFANFTWAQGEYPVPPSPEHARLKAMVGVWDAKIEMETPDGKTATTGVETVKMLGEVWVVSDFTYEFMGKPTHGHGSTGYDPSKGKYVGNWIESGSPHISTMEGEYDEEKGAIVYIMKSKDQEGNDTVLKAIDKQIDATHKVFEMHAPVSEDEFVKIMTITYTKRDE